MKSRLNLNKSLHISWFVAWVSGGVLVGIAAASVVNPDYFVGKQLLITACSLLFIIILKRTVWAIVLAVLVGVLIGLYRGSVVKISLIKYEPYYNQQVLLHGRVSEDVVRIKDGEQRLRLGKIELNQQKMTGQAWVNTGSNQDIKRGDYVTFKGSLKEGFGNFAASMNSAEVVGAERPRPGDIGRLVRDWFVGGINRAIPEPEASLAAGYLVGQRSSLPEDLDKQLRTLGLTHIVVASGFNLTILVRFARRSLSRASKYLAALASSTMIIGFVMIAGFSPSMSRAALVTGLSLAAWYFGRSIQPMVLLPFAAAITALMNPTYIWGDIGWYLSFLAFAGVIILAPIINHYFWGVRAKPRAIRQLIIETSSAQILTMPIIAFVFGQYAPLALLANVLILPLIPLTMLLTFISGLAGVFLPGLAIWFGLPANAALQYMTYVTEQLSRLHVADGEVSLSLQNMLASYFVITLLGVWMWRKTKHNFDKDNIVE